MRKKTVLQTHVRIKKKDKSRLESFMKKRNIRSQAEALNKIFNIARI